MDLQDEWTKRLNNVYCKLVELFPATDMSAVTTPLWDEDTLTPVQAYTESFARGLVHREWDSVDQVGGEFVWIGTIKENFPVFTTMVEMLALEADDVYRQM